MKTQNVNNKLKFDSKSISELNKKDQLSIQGGSTNAIVDWINRKIKEGMSPIA